MTEKAKTITARSFTVPEVWRTIVKKNERQGSERFDVLVCAHVVPANDNTFRRVRSCPECRVKVQQYADTVRAASSAATSEPPPPAARTKAPPVKAPRAAAARAAVAASRTRPPLARKGRRPHARRRAAATSRTPRPAK